MRHSRHARWSSACARAGITAADLDYVGFYDKPLLKFERILETYLSVAPRGFGQFLKAGPLWIKEELYQDRDLRAALGDWDGPLLYAEHHESHAASAFYPSPFEGAARGDEEGSPAVIREAFAVGAPGAATRHR